MTVPDDIRRRLFLDMAAVPHRRGPWSQAEDNYLMNLVQTQGALNWVRIANMLGSRTPKQCRERYHQNLKPTLNHEPITPEEGVVIERLVRELGKRWAEIARRLHGRSDNAVKNWWNGSQNRKKRMERRRVSHVAYDERVDDHPTTSIMYGRAVNPLHAAVIRPLPFPGSRPLPPPLYHASLHSHERPYGSMDTPLPSPSVCSEGAPSLMSDTGSHYPTSPMSYNVRSSPKLELPPLKVASAYTSPSPTDTMLPSLSVITSPRYHGSPDGYNNNNNNNNNNNSSQRADNSSMINNAESITADIPTGPRPHHQQQHHYNYLPAVIAPLPLPPPPPPPGPGPPPGYHHSHPHPHPHHSRMPISHLPTAPNSPTGYLANIQLRQCRSLEQYGQWQLYDNPQHRERLRLMEAKQKLKKEEEKRREERTTKVLSLSNLLS